MKSRILIACLVLIAAGCGTASAVASSVEVTADTKAESTGLGENRVVASEGATPNSTSMDSPTDSNPTNSTETTMAPGPSAHPAPTPGVVDRWIPDIRVAYPHDPAAFTQGLVVYDGELYEGTGLYEKSDIRRVDLDTGAPLASVALAPEMFGEGLALVDDRLIQLTWREGVAIVWTLQLEEVGRFPYEGEGWGLCDDGTRLVMSDGSATLQFRDRLDFEQIGSVEVTLEGVPVELLNELECVDGLVFANVWQSTDIFVIDSADGSVTAVIDASDLDEWSGDNSAADINGIAYDPERGVFYVTGKLWPVLYEVVFVAS